MMISRQSCYNDKEMDGFLYCTQNAYTEENQGFFFLGVKLSFVLQVVFSKC